MFDCKTLYTKQKLFSACDPKARHAEDIQGEIRDILLKLEKKVTFLFFGSSYPLKRVRKKNRSITKLYDVKVSKKKNQFMVPSSYEFHHKLSHVTNFRVTGV